MKRGQASIEYLIVAGFVFMILTILFVVYYEYDRSSRIQLVYNQVDLIGRKIASSSEEVFFLGEPTRVRLRVYMPEKINQIAIQGKSIVFYVKTPNGISEIEVPVAVNVTGTISTQQGVKYLRVEAQEENVLITEE